MEDQVKDVYLVHIRTIIMASPRHEIIFAIQICSIKTYKSADELK